MKSTEKSSRFHFILPLVLLISVYFFLSLSGITNPVTDQEAKNYQYFNDFLTKASPSPIDTNKTLVQLVYFHSLSLWIKIFNPSLITYRSFSFFCGGLVILILFFIIKRKITVKTTTLLLAIFAFNPFFIQSSQRMTMHTEQILLTLLFFLFSQQLLKFFSKDKLFPKTKTVFSIKSPLTFLCLAILTLILVISSTYQSLVPKSNVRKIIASIYQMNSRKADSDTQNKLSFLVFDQDYTPSIYLENQLIAKELHKTPLAIQWHQELDQFISRAEATDFWYVKPQNQSDHNIIKNSQIYSETDQVLLEGFSATHFQNTKRSPSNSSPIE